MKLQLHPDLAPVVVAIREGRFWKQGRSHRVRSLTLSSLGHGLDEQFVVSQADTVCGLTVDRPTISKPGPGGPVPNPCQAECWRS